MSRKGRSPANCCRSRTTGFWISTESRAVLGVDDTVRLMSSMFCTSMRPPLALCLAAVFAGPTICSTAHAQGVAAATIKMTVTAHDKEAVHAISLQLAGQGQAVALAITTTDAALAAAAKVDARTTYSVSTTRTGALTEAQVDGIQAQCRNYAARPGMRCTIETTYGTL